MSYMNLLPESYIKKQFRDRVDMVCVIVFGFIMAGAILFNGISTSSFNRARGRYENAKIMSAQASVSTGEFFTLQRAKDVMITEAKDAMKMEECVPRSYLLGVITNSLPQTVSLTKIELQTQIPVIKKDKKDLITKGGNSQRKSSINQPQIEDAPAPEPVVTVTLEGVSVSGNDYEVAKFIRELKKKGLFKKVEPIYARKMQSKKSGGQQQLREFKISMELRNDVDVRKLIKADAQDVAKPSLDELDETEIEMGKSSVKGAAK